MEKKKTKEEFEKKREEYLDLKKHKEDLKRDPTKKPPQRVSGWGGKLKPVKKDRMGEKRTLVRQKTP